MNSRIKWLVVGTVLLGSVVFAAPAFAAAPANDNFAAATSVAGSSGSTSGTTIGATNEAAEPSGGSLGVWYSWQPSVSGATIFQTCGAASYDSWVDVFTGSSLGSLSLVASGDDGCGSGSTASLVAFRAQAGNPLLVRVSGLNGQQGTFTLSWAMQTNDDLETPQVVTATPAASPARPSARPMSPGRRPRAAAASGTRGPPQEQGRSRSTRARAQDSTPSSTRTPEHPSRRWYRSRATMTLAARLHRVTTGGSAASPSRPPPARRIRSESAARPGPRRTVGASRFRGATPGPTRRGPLRPASAS